MQIGILCWFNVFSQDLGCEVIEILLSSTMNELSASCGRISSATGSSLQLKLTGTSKYNINYNRESIGGTMMMTIAWRI